MKKLLTAVVVLSMILTLGTTAFADTTGIEIKEGETIGITITVDTTKDGVNVIDVNGILTLSKPIIINDTQIAVNVTAPEKTAGKLTKLVVKNDEGKVIGGNTEEYVVSILAPATPPKPVDPEVLPIEKLEESLTVSDNNATVNMGEYTGIAAEVYNELKNKNYDKIIFALSNGATWTLTRGDYTKMNVTASIYFGVESSTTLTKVVDGKVVRDEETENKVLKALGNTKADPFYVVIDSHCNIANVATKPELVVKVANTWLDYNNIFSVKAYSFNGETATKVAENLSIKPSTGRMTLNLTKAGTYVFVDSNTWVNLQGGSSSNNNGSTQKPNTNTGANSTAAVVALVVMAAAAVAVKKTQK